MTVPIKRVPPPPPIARNDPVFNRWLHDFTAFITEGGGIDPGTIPGYDTLVSNVARHTVQISSLIIDVDENTSDISSLTSQVATNTSNIASNTTAINTLTARSQVLNGTAAPDTTIGIDGDWFADTTAKHIYVRVTGSWVLIV